MLQTNNNIDKILTAVFAIVLSLFGLYFLYTLITSVISPVFITKEVETTVTSFDPSFQDAVNYLKNRENFASSAGDLTGTTPSATLNKEANQKITAEIVNGSGIAGAAKTLSDQLQEMGISIFRVSNSKESKDTILSFKNTSLLYKDAIVEKIGTKSGEIRFETLSNTETVDIRIVIGK